MYSRARLSPASALAAEDWSVCSARFAASIVRWTWVSMKPGAHCPLGEIDTRRTGRPPHRSLYLCNPIALDEDLSWTGQSIGETVEHIAAHQNERSSSQSLLTAAILPILRRTRWLRSAAVTPSDRKTPTAANGHKAEPKAEDRACDRHRGRGKWKSCPLTTTAAAARAATA